MQYQKNHDSNITLMLLSVLFTILNLGLVYSTFVPIEWSLICLSILIFKFFKSRKHIRTGKAPLDGTYKLHTDIAFIISIIASLFLVGKLLKFLVYFLGSSGIIKP